MDRSSDAPKRIVCCGEAMLELARHRGAWGLGYAGDMLNTAIHLARAGHDVAFLTALGTDPFSEELRAGWRDEGLDGSLILTHPDRQPGLYAIRDDDRGDRSITYWRENSAAREMFALPGMADAIAIAEQADLLLFSLVTLAILPPEARLELIALAIRVRARGGKVAFDGNFRAPLWRNPREAIAARDVAIAIADFGFPTLEDEAMLGGATDADAIAAHWLALGCGETVVKLGARGCRLSYGPVIAPPAVLEPIDPGGAGDAFDAGYLDARLRGRDPGAAARAGHALAGWTIMRHGAIPPR